MNSFNHYSYGAIGDWMYRVMAGIDCFEDGVGYKHIKIMPHPGGDLNYVSASLDTYYGKIRSGWKKDGTKLLLDVEIPENTGATVYLPTTNPESVREGSKSLSDLKELKIKNDENGYQVIELGSGKYHFEMDAEAKAKQ
jgi:alpha-L-rhamnosidase